MAKDLLINLRIIEQLAKVTVKNLIDGIVELITNSDDSYRRLKDEDKKVSGEILIYVNRRKGGICEKLIVKDFAEGMTRDELEKAIVFGGETSGFEAGRSVRGLFGRGLKETIISLGEGEIKTIKNGKLCGTKLWWDKKIKKPQYDDELLDNVLDTKEPDGTEISVCITNEKIKIPEYEKFKEQLSKHYALRDIMSSIDRKILLTFEDIKRDLKRINEQVTFSYPEGERLEEKEFNLPEYGDKVKITIYESPIPLDSPRYNPYGLGGILIKTKGAILDNQLFRFENDPVALYFFGEVMCDGLEERLRKGETEIIDSNRVGLEWRHEYCSALETAIENILEPLVLEKKRTLEKKPEKEVKESTKKMLRRLRNFLNELAKQELEEVTELPTEIPVELTQGIRKLVIKPEKANIQKDKPRSFRIYALTEIVKDQGEEAHIKSDNPIDIQPLASAVRLEKYHKDPEKIWYRDFKVVGKSENAEGTLTVTLGRETASAKVTVAPPKERGKGDLTGRKGGFISEIEPDASGSHVKEERTFYERATGIIWINVNFPSVAKFIKNSFEGTETSEGKVLLAELVGEAFCRELARRKLETNPPPPGGEIDAFNSEMNKIQRRTLHQIQEIIFAWKFKE